MNRKLFLGLGSATGTAVFGFVFLKGTDLSSDAKIGRVFAKSDAGYGREVESETSPRVDVEDDLTLKQVQIFFRHGARTPLSTTSNIDQVNYEERLFLSGLPHTLYNYTVCNLDGGPQPVSPLERHYRKTVLRGGAYIGQLTGLGQDQTYLLGRRLRRRYLEKFGLISQQYDPDNFLPQTTNTQRTIDSLRCVVAGLYGVEHLRQLDNVVLYTQPLVDDYLVPNGHHCEFLKQLNHKTLTNYGNIPGVREDRLKVEEALGIDSSSDVKKRLNMVALRDDIVCRQSHGFLVPKQLRGFQEFIEFYALGMLSYANAGPDGALRQDVLKLSMGRALLEMMKKIEGALKGQRGHKMVLYSCHDTSLISLLVALGMNDDKQWPPFAADVAVELYEDKAGEHWVKVLYLGENVTGRRFGKPVVRVSEMRSALSNLIVDNSEYRELCDSKLPSRLPAPDNLNLPEGSFLPDHLETPEESADADERAERPAGM